MHYVAVSIQGLQLGIELVIGFRVRHMVTTWIRNRATEPTARTGIRVRNLVYGQI